MRLTDAEREWIAHMLEDALMPYGREFNAGDAARLIEARLETLLRNARADAWAEGHYTPQRLGDDGCECFAGSPGECACGRYGSVVVTPNPYKEATA